MTAEKDFKRLVRDRARRTGESYAAARREVLRKRSEKQMDEPATPTVDRLVDATATGIRVSAETQTPFLVLRENGGDREVPIAIGPTEATAIAFALQDVAVKRPMTHDALKQAVDALGARVTTIIVALQQEARTFTADVVLALEDGREQHLDWRVSDAVALAVRCHPQPAILVPESLLADGGSPAPESASWSGGVRVRCACGEWIPLPPDAVEQATRSDADHIEVDVECPSCGTQRHVVVERPPSASSHASGKGGG